MRSLRPPERISTKSPALRLAVAFIAGILLADRFDWLTPLFWYSISAGTFLVYFYAEWRLSRGPAWYLHRIILLLYLIVAVWTGAAIHSVTLAGEQVKERHRLLLQLFEDEKITVTGSPAECNRSGSRTVLLFDVEKSDLNGEQWIEPYRARLTVNAGLTADSVCRSVRAVLDLRIYPAIRPLNPGEFDPWNWMAGGGFELHGELLDVQVLREGRSDFWQVLRQSVRDKLERMGSERLRPLATALVTGSREMLDEEQSRQFSRAGLAHIMAVSGLHVGFLLAPFWLLLRISRGWQWGPALLLLLLVPVLVLYAGLAGFRAPVCRAAVTGWFWMLSLAGGRNGYGLNLLALSALLILTIDSRQLFKIGFQLSYSALAVILTVLPVLTGAVPVRFRKGLKGKVIGLLMLSAVVQTGLIPMLGWYFEEVSLVGPLTNLLTVPLLSLILPWTLILLLIPGLPDSVLTGLNRPNEWGLEWIQKVAVYVGQSDWSWAEVSFGSAWIFLLWGVGLFWVASFRDPARRPVFTVLLALVTAGWMFHALVQHIGPAEATVTILNVGQGDAVHIETPGGRHLLIDTGWWSPHAESGERTLLPYFEYKGVERLDGMILTHPHADHIGGARSVLREIKVDSVYLCGGRFDGVVAGGVMEKIGRQNIPVRTVGKGDLIHTDPAIRMFVVGPGLNASTGNPNNRSVMIRMVYGENSILFAGDAERQQEERVTRVYGDFLRSDLLKVGHHGSRTSSTREFLQQVQPGVSVISAGASNRFGHPHREALERLTESGARVFVTGYDGAVVLRSDGRRLRGTLMGSSRFE